MAMLTRRGLFGTLIALIASRFVPPVPQASRFILDQDGENANMTHGLPMYAGNESDDEILVLKSRDVEGHWGHILGPGEHDTFGTFTKHS